MKRIIFVVAALALFGLTGCEEAHEHWHHGGAGDDYYKGYGHGSDDSYRYNNPYGYRYNPVYPNYPYSNDYPRHY